MVDEEDFLKAIVAAPCDDLTRLVYADWLEERGDGARATFLRLECAWTALPARTDLECVWHEEEPPADVQYHPILRRLTDAADEIPLKWLALVSRIGQEFQDLIERIRRVAMIRSTDLSAAANPRLARWPSLMADLRQMFESHVGKEVTQERFAIPVDYLLFAAATSGEPVQPSYFGMPRCDFLYQPETVARETISRCEMYAEMHGPGEHLANCGLWLYLGYREKHNFHLCCDLASPFFGLVVEMEDDHPWRYPPDGPFWCEVKTRSFLDFVRWNVVESDRARATIIETVVERPPGIR